MGLLPIAIILSVALRQTSSVIIMARQELTSKLVRSKCQPETGVSTEAIEGVPEGKFPDDRNLKCYMKCAMTMTLTMRDGKLRTDIALSMAEKLSADIKDRVIAAIQKCSSADDGLTDPCEVAFTATKCIHDADSEVC
ncbi:hypothetical protein B7P43_G02248 [Cryptotermes secundus]|uniref:Uncharacterized protein n=1 Tax=Cryptotermes secundus TaxID=105785 RepID=A0A2J7PNG9_9NEOP|nr:hypothetical protein B7P43_G02248 [Cryptotermes secundus]